MKPDDPAPLFAALLLLLVLSGLDQTLLGTMLPARTRALGHPELAPWVFSTYLTAATIAVPVYGKLADRCGPWPMLLAAAALFTLGSAACAAAPSMPVLIAARALQGLGGGGLMTLAVLTTAWLYPLAERGRRMGADRRGLQPGDARRPARRRRVAPGAALAVGLSRQPAVRGAGLGGDPAQPRRLARLGAPCGRPGRAAHALSRRRVRRRGRALGAERRRAVRGGRVLAALPAERPAAGCAALGHLQPAADARHHARVAVRRSGAAGGPLAGGADRASPAC